MDDLAGVSILFLCLLAQTAYLTSCSLGDVINDWRKTIDLEAVPITEGPNLAATLKIPFTYCWSPALVPKPRDWASHIGMLRIPLIYTPLTSQMSVVSSSAIRQTTNHPPTSMCFLEAGLRPYTLASAVSL